MNKQNAEFCIFFKKILISQAYLKFQLAEL